MKTANWQLDYRIAKRILLFYLVVSMFSCATEVEVFSPGDPIPVVYCLLNPDSTTQYVRIGKTWSITTGDSLRYPLLEDLILDEDVLVYFSEERSNIKQRIYYCEPTQEVVKDSGWFPSEALQLYKAEIELLPDCTYSLYVHFLESDKIVYGQTKSFGSTFRIIDPDLVPGRRLIMYPGEDYYVRCTPVMNGSIFQSTMYFNYLEKKGDTFLSRCLDLPQRMVFEDDMEVNYVAQRISGERFYIDLSRILKQDPEIERIPLGFDFELSAGGDDLALKIRAENDKQSFSILEVNSFDNAFGVFSCLVHRKVQDVPISHFMIDSLALNNYTKDLGFLTVEQLDSMDYEIK